jgi:4-alpha-glucanotransferase
MRFPRSSGILLHATSLPGRFGIGDLGPEAHAFVDFLAETGQMWWQVLPLGPTGGMNSPYQSPSSFAGNPLLISPESMQKHGWITTRDLASRPDFPQEHVDFAAVAHFKGALLRRAFEGFPSTDPQFQAFLRSNASWLDDYALFMALKELNHDKPWQTWEPGLVARKPEALARWREKLDASVRYHQFVQYVFETQMRELRAHCRERRVKLIGDIPIFVAQDSADVWAHPDLFFLDRRGRPTVQAGVPPDYFSSTGQLWGNPLYRWEAHQREDFTWWIERLSALLRWVDLIRIDHFRGFEAYWEVPGKAKTAVKGRWVPAPGESFFRTLQKHFEDLPLIAEDLGVITPPVEALRDQFGLPGMRVLQFGFSTNLEDEKHLPHRFVPHCIVYTGTHDNDTSVGWFTSTNVQATLSAGQIKTERALALQYLGTDGRAFHWDLIRLAFSSVADVAIVPMQDLLGLDSSARMNIPGKAAGNWAWRYRAAQLTRQLKDRLSRMTALYGRWNGPIPEEYDPRKVRPSRKTGVTSVRPSGDDGADPTTNAGRRKQANGEARLVPAARKRKAR